MRTFPFVNDFLLSVMSYAFDYDDTHERIAIYSCRLFVRVERTYLITY